MIRQGKHFVCHVLVGFGGARNLRICRTLGPQVTPMPAQRGLLLENAASAEECMGTHSRECYGRAG